MKTAAIIVLLVLLAITYRQAVQYRNTLELVSDAILEKQGLFIYCIYTPQMLKSST